MINCAAKQHEQRRCFSANIRDVGKLDRSFATISNWVSLDHPEYLHFTQENIHFVLFLAPPAERQQSFSNAELSVVVVRRLSSTFHLKYLFLRNRLITFLAPPAERQRSFSNAELSVVRRRCQLFT